MNYWIRYTYISCEVILNYSAGWYYNLAFAHFNVRGLKLDWARMEQRKKNLHIIDRPVAWQIRPAL